MFGTIKNIVESLIKDLMGEQGQNSDTTKINLTKQKS